MPSSSEFVSLCQAQVVLLTQGLGASLSVVYLMQQLVESEPQLVPIVAYPERAIGGDQRILPFPLATPVRGPLRLSSQSVAVSPETEDESVSETVALVAQRQVVLPLVHEEVMVGMLVVGRDDRAWSEWEQSQIQQVASTIAIACVLDQRYQWLEHDRQQQREIQLEQRDRLDNLLHQFRNSLMALQTFGKLILKRLLPNDPNQGIANSLVREATRLRELSQQIEAVSETDAESLPLLPPASGAPRLLTGSLALEACSVREILEPLLASAATIAHDRALTLHSTIASNLPLVLANPQALREVLNNVIENAVKYTPAGGEIWVEANPVSLPYAIEIAVSDTGPGIPPADLPHIFERRYRGVQAESEVPGSGLGLAIARSLLEQMHGEIRVISPARFPVGVQATSPGTTLLLSLLRMEQPSVDSPV